MPRETSDECGVSEPVQVDRDHVRGAPNATVTLLEYGDYECLHCAVALRTLSAVLARAAA